MPTTLKIAKEYFPHQVLRDKPSLPDDFTFYLHPDDLAQIAGAEAVPSCRESLDNYGHWEGEIVLDVVDKLVPARASICRAYAAQLLSISVRLTETAPISPASPTRSNPIWSTAYAARDLRDAENLNSIKDICTAIDAEISPIQGGQRRDREDWQGLVVVCGSTASAKSKITRGLIDMHLQHLTSDAKLRRPHLVTFEDPIEVYFGPDHKGTKEFLKTVRGGSIITIPAHQLNVDYTPRQRPTDAKGLSEVLGCAKRQTPKILFAGETRNRTDLKKLVDFAGSGHLVVTTYHAGSLVEAMKSIFGTLGARTPAARSEVAMRLLAVIHLKRFTVGRVNVLLPAMWRRTGRGLNNLTASGMASILPGSGGESSLGRYSFAAKLLEMAKTRPPTDEKMFRKLSDRVLRTAVDFDLRGD